jgi:hypothetical protein
MGIRRKLSRVAAATVCLSAAIAVGLAVPAGAAT